MKKSFFLALLVFVSNKVFAYGECLDVKVTEILSGPQYEGLVRVNSADCGNNGWICTHAEKDVTELMSNKIFSMALAAKLSQTNVRVRWNEEADYGCNGSFPMVFDFRLM